MKQEVAERMNELASQGRRNPESAAVDRLALVSRQNRRHVTNAATVLPAHRIKQVSSGIDVGFEPRIVLNVAILRWCLCSTHELRERPYVFRSIFTTKDCG